MDTLQFVGQLTSKNDYEDAEYTPEGPFDPTGIDSDEECFNSSEPAHHARRPMNAFLIFCKRHRSVVRERYPSLENRCITKILGEWWAQLEPQEKACYTELAKQYKEAFLRANPDFKWYKLPAPPLRTLVTRPSNQKPPRMECPLATGPIVPGKLADESQMGGLSSLLSSPPMTPTSPSVPKPPKKRYLEETFSATSSTASGPNWDTLQPEKSEHSRSNSPDSDGKDSGLCTLSPTISTSGSTGLGPGWAGLLANTTTVQASQQQLIERVVDRMCSNFTPLLTTAQPAWNPQSRETNNNETTCVNVNAGTSKDDEGETEETEREEQEATPTCKQSYSEADSGLSSREDLTLGMGMLGMGGNTAEEDEEGQCQASTSAAGRRKSLRACKGKRYQEFMSTGRLASGKRSVRSQVTPTSESSAAMQERKRRHDSGSSTASEKTDSAFSEGSRGSRDPDEMSLKEKNTPLPDREPEHTPKKRRRLSETSEESYSDSSVRKRFRAADFNLDEKIEALPSLSLEEFQQKKKAKKKRILCSPVTPRKNMIVRERSPPPESEGATDESFHSPNKTPLVGSQKRKARRPPTRLDPNSPHSSRDTSVVEPEVLNTIGLATLAEVASAKRRLIK